MNSDKHQRLVEKALRLKKAFLCVVALLGKEFTGVTEADLAIPHYQAWDNKKLKQYIDVLEDDIDSFANCALLDWKRSNSNLSRTVDWLASAYDAWERTGFGLFDLGRVHEVEKFLGRLGFRREKECPPYAQVLLQGWHGAAIRHPEYHLAHDLGLLYNLFLDSEAILDDARRLHIVCSSQDSQSLARSVILTCFNLLESFVSGLGVGWLIDNPNAPVDQANILHGKKPNGREFSLREKFTLYPATISGKPRFDNNQHPFAQLFGECKQRRDSFVHCEPGSSPSTRGYIKEDYFHDVEAPAVQTTVNLTIEAISLAWKQVHGSESPKWMPKRDSTGRFNHFSVSLKPSTSAGQPP